MWEIIVMAIVAGLVAFAACTLIGAVVKWAVVFAVVFVGAYIFAKLVGKLKSPILVLPNSESSFKADIDALRSYVTEAIASVKTDAVAAKVDVVAEIKAPIAKVESWLKPTEILAEVKAPIAKVEGWIAPVITEVKGATTLTSPLVAVESFVSKVEAEVPVLTTIVTKVEEVAPAILSEVKAIV